MKKYHRETLREARRIAEAYGGSVELVGNKPHCKLVLRLRGKHRVTAIAGSPRSTDAAKRMKRGDVVRIFKEMTGQ